MQNHAIPHPYGVLVGVSPRYPPVQGRLHTRYAPVRRSPAEYCYSLLPLDLHVLGLPLAFILSQDQTLHCKNCSSCRRGYTAALTNLLTRSCPPAYLNTRDWHTLSLVSSVSISSRFLPPFQPLVFPSKASAKIQPFFKLTNFFSKKTKVNLQQIVLQLRKRQKNFIPHTKNIGKHAPNQQKNQKTVTFPTKNKKNVTIYYQSAF